MIWRACSAFRGFAWMLTLITKPFGYTARLSMATTASSFSWTTALIARRRGRVPSDGRSQTGGAHACSEGGRSGGRGWKKVELEGTGSDAIGKPQLGYVPEQTSTGLDLHTDPKLESVAAELARPAIAAMTDSSKLAGGNAPKVLTLNCKKVDPTT